MQNKNLIPTEDEKFFIEIRTNQLIEAVKETVGVINSHELINNLHVILTGFMNSQTAREISLEELSQITYYQTFLMTALQGLDFAYSEYKKGGQL